MALSAGDELEKRRDGHWRINLDKIKELLRANPRKPFYLGMNYH